MINIKTKEDTKQNGLFYECDGYFCMKVDSNIFYRTDSTCLRPAFTFQYNQIFYPEEEWKPCKAILNYTEGIMSKGNILSLPAGETFLLDNVPYIKVDTKNGSQTMSLLSGSVYEVSPELEYSCLIDVTITIYK